MAVQRIAYTRINGLASKVSSCSAYIDCYYTPTNSIKQLTVSFKMAKWPAHGSIVRISKNITMYTEKLGSIEPNPTASGRIFFLLNAMKYKCKVCRIRF